MKYLMCIHLQELTNEQHRRFQLGVFLKSLIYCRNLFPSANKALVY